MFATQHGSVAKCGTFSMIVEAPPGGVSATGPNEAMTCQRLQQVAIRCVHLTPKTQEMIDIVEDRNRIGAGAACLSADRRLSAH